MNSRSKGKRGELEARDAVRLHWGAAGAHRSAQRSGKDTADLRGALPGAHVEVKRHKRIATLRFLEQAERDRRPEEIPVVLMREDHGPWVVMLHVADTPTFARALAEQLRLAALEDLEA